MDALAKSHRLLKSRYEIVVIGSGYGGSTAASRMARAGRDVCVLERGREIPPGEYPDTAAKLLKQLQSDFPDKQLGSQTGLFDFRYNKDISVLVGCGLGGTSLINANINEAADPRIFQDPVWPSEIREEATNGSLDKFGGYADDMLKPSLYPHNYPPLVNQIAFKQAGKTGFGQFKSVRINVNYQSGVNHVGIEQKPCINCGDCMSGCNFSAKNTLLMNYLPDASNHGAQLFTQLKVNHLQKLDAGWRVHIQSTDPGAEVPAYIEADIVILGAGSLGSTEILLRSAGHDLQLSGRVGERFSGNGDMVGIGYNTDRQVNAIGFGHSHRHEAVGPTSTAAIDARDNNSIENGMVIAAASIPGALATLLPKGLATMAKLLGQGQDRGCRDLLRKKSRQLQSYFLGAYSGAVRNTQFYLSVTQDDSGGRLYLQDDRLRISWPGAGESATLALANETLKRLSTSLGGSYIPNPIWSDFAGQSLLSGHPLGGCVIADDASKGVVNHKGQVYSSSRGKAVYNTLYVMDGAVLPRSVGINPLNIITTLAERSCHYLVSDFGWTTSYGFKRDF